MKEWKKRPLLAAFCIPVAIMLAAVVYKGIYPFGDACFLRIDMYNQYMPFFTEFHRKLRTGGSLFYSWNAGLGANFTALYAYYLASPFNWLLVFCPEPLIIEFMTALIVIKIGLCGLSFAWYLKRHFQTDRYTITLFGIFYALSGYTAAYNWNIMWLDCVAITPVIIYGLELLIGKRKYLLYCAALGFSILTNYYISIMICIFLVFYAVPLLLQLSGERRKQAALDFLVCSLLAGGLAAVVWVPGVLAVGGSRFDLGNFPTKVKLYFNFIEIIARHGVNVAAELQENHFPNIYCGAAVFLLLPLYALCRRIPWREKLPRLFLLAFFYLSFSVNILEYFWHGLNYPNNLPARQSFLYIFLVLTLCFEAAEHLADVSGRQMLLVTAFSVCFLAFCGFWMGNEDYKAGSFAFTIFYLILYALLLYWYKARQLKTDLATVLLACLVIMESAMNLIETSVFTTSRSEYTADYRANKSLMEYVRQEKEGFSRVEVFDRMTKNDGMLADFPTATLFSSTVNGDMAAFYRKMGMSSSMVFYSYEGATPLASALLAVGDMVSDDPEIGDDFHTLAESRGGLYLYRKKYTLPIGYMIPADLEEKWGPEGMDPLKTQNRLITALGIEGELFEELPADLTGGRTAVTVPKQGYVYGYLKKCGSRDAAVLTDGRENVYSRVYYPYVLDIGWCGEGARISASCSGDTLREGEGLELAAYRLDRGVLRKAIHRLKEEPFLVKELTDTYMAGEIEVRNAGIMATSIPNEAGWQIRVDGERVSPRPVYDNAMLGVELAPGSHRVEFCYRPPGVLAGAFISLLSLSVLFVPFWLNKGDA